VRGHEGGETLRFARRPCKADGGRPPGIRGAAQGVRVEEAHTNRSKRRDMPVARTTDGAGSGVRPGRLRSGARRGRGPGVHGATRSARPLEENGTDRSESTVAPGGVGLVAMTAVGGRSRAQGVIWNADRGAGELAFVRGPARPPSTRGSRGSSSPRSCSPVFSSRTTNCLRRCDSGPRGAWRGPQSARSANAQQRGGASWQRDWAGGGIPGARRHAGGRDRGGGRLCGAGAIDHRRGKGCGLMWARRGGGRVWTRSRCSGGWRAFSSGAGSGRRELGGGGG